MRARMRGPIIRWWHQGAITGLQLCVWAFSFASKNFMADTGEFSAWLQRSIKMRFNGTLNEHNRHRFPTSLARPVVQAVAPLLVDPVRAVRIEAARTFAGVDPRTMTPEQQSSFASAYRELFAAETVGWMPSGRRRTSILVCLISGASNRMKRTRNTVWPYG